MLPESAEESGALRAFKAASLELREAFNHHDFDAAFARLPADIEWQPLAEIPGAHLLQGRDEVIAWFQGIAALFPDFSSETMGITEPAPGVVVVEFANRGTGRASGLAVTGPITYQVWEITRKPWRVREYGSLSEAHAAAGLPEQSPSSPGASADSVRRTHGRR